LKVITEACVAFLGLTLLAATMGNGVYPIYTTVPNKAAGTSLCGPALFIARTLMAFQAATLHENLLCQLSPAAAGLSQFYRLKDFTTLNPAP
jgi:hypothetical protein